MSFSVQLFAFNAPIAAELRSRLQEVDEQGRSIVLEAPLKFQPSSYQRAIFDWVRDGRGSLIVRAVAGSGKSTTVLHALRHIPGLRGTRDVSAKTFHAVGFAAVLKRLGKRGDEVKADGNKMRRLALDMFTINLDQVRADRTIRREIYASHEVYSDFVCKLVGLAKGAGIGPLVPDIFDNWYKLVSHHDLFLDSSEKDEYGDDLYTEEKAIGIAQKLLHESNKVALAGDLDFDDMLYLPLLWKLRLWQNDWVIVDEAQDTNPVRRAIAKLALRPGGRLIAVGDEKQAIYGFTGASHDAMDLIRREFNCSELPLTVSYRCPVSVAEKVRPLVPYFEIPTTAIQGVSTAMPLAEAAKLWDSHDVVLCRQTAPLIDLAFTLIGRGIGCTVLGKEIGTGLIKLIERQRAKGIPHLVAKLEAYKDREVTKFMAKGEEGKAEAVTDRVSCVMTVINHLDELDRTIPALIRRLETMFSDTNGVLSLATIHKVKGKEYRRVFILRPELMPSKWARQEHQYQQELNLQYVAWTRATELLAELTTDHMGE